eukprot:scaffold28092_cov60-Phaeocystis_antarctica.AAC.1
MPSADAPLAAAMLDSSSRLASRGDDGGGDGDGPSWRWRWRWRPVAMAMVATLMGGGNRSRTTSPPTRILPVNACHVHRLGRIGIHQWLEMFRTITLSELL